MRDPDNTNKNWSKSDVNMLNQSLYMISYSLSEFACPCPLECVKVKYKFAIGKPLHDLQFHSDSNFTISAMVCEVFIRTFNILQIRII